MIKGTMRKRILLFVILLHAGGCGFGGPSYRSSPVEEAPVPDLSRASGDYIVMAEPYSEPERQEAFFFADFRKTGILPIHVTVRNPGGRPVSVRREDMLLALPSGHWLSPLSAFFAAAFTEERTGSSINVFAFIIFEREFYAWDRRRFLESRFKRLADYQAKEFKDAILAPGESADGFVFFRPPPGTPAFDEAELRVLVLSEPGKAGDAVSVSVAGLAFAGRDPNPTAIVYAPRARKCTPAENPDQPWLGGWRATDGNAKIMVHFANGVVVGKITTPTHPYYVHGTVDTKGRINAVIQYRGAPDKAELSGEFPNLRAFVNIASPGDYRPLRDAKFQLCT